MEINQNLLNFEEKIEVKDKNKIIGALIECIEEAIELDSGDSEKEDILSGLTDLCYKATGLPTKKAQRQWVKVWRRSRSERGSFSFLTTELLISDEASYKNYLRMSKTQFDFVLNLLEQHLMRADTQMRDSIPPAEKLALTLRFLASGETFRSLNYQTRVGSSTISGIVPEVCKAICKRMNAMYLKFPRNSLQWEAIAKEFAIKWQFPNCLGALDGKHISFRPLRKDGAYYHNYKGTNSIILMALVDANCKFIFVDIGCNGRSNDAGVFLQTTLKAVLEEEKEIPPNAVVGNGRCLPFVVVGDDAFPLQKHLMKPYPYHSRSTEKQMYNARLSRARHVVEHAFGILANRFIVFLSPINLKVETVETVTYACCILHNFLLEIDESYINSVDAPLLNDDINDNIDNVYNPRKGAAEGYRQQFMSYFNHEGKLDWI